MIGCHPRHRQHNNTTRLRRAHGPPPFPPPPIREEVGRPFGLPCGLRAEGFAPREASVFAYPTLFCLPSRVLVLGSSLPVGVPWVHQSRRLAPWPGWRLIAPPRVLAGLRALATTLSPRPVRRCSPRARGPPSSSSAPLPTGEQGGLELAASDASCVCITAAQNPEKPRRSGRCSPPPPPSLFTSPGRFARGILGIPAGENLAVFILPTCGQGASIALPDFIYTMFLKGRWGRRGMPLPAHYRPAAASGRPGRG